MNQGHAEHPEKEKESGKSLEKHDWQSGLSTQSSPGQYIHSTFTPWHVQDASSSTPSNPPVQDYLSQSAPELPTIQHRDRSKSNSTKPVMIPVLGKRTTPPSSPNAKRRGSRTSPGNSPIDSTRYTGGISPTSTTTNPLFAEEETPSEPSWTKVEYKGQTVLLYSAHISTTHSIDKDTIRITGGLVTMDSKNITITKGCTVICHSSAHFYNEIEDDRGNATRDKRGNDTSKNYAIEVLDGIKTIMVQPSDLKVTVDQPEKRRKKTPSSSPGKISPRAPSNHASPTSTRTLPASGSYSQSTLPNSSNSTTYEEEEKIINNHTYELTIHAPNIIPSNDIPMDTIHILNGPVTNEDYVITVHHGCTIMCNPNAIFYQIIHNSWDEVSTVFQLNEDTLEDIKSIIIHRQLSQQPVPPTPPPSPQKMPDIKNSRKANRETLSKTARSPRPSATNTRNDACNHYQELDTMIAELERPLNAPQPMPSNANSSFNMVNQDLFRQTHNNGKILIVYSNFSEATSITPCNNMAQDVLLITKGHVQNTPYEIIIPASSTIMCHPETAKILFAHTKQHENNLLSDTTCKAEVFSCIKTVIASNLLDKAAEKS